MINIESIKNDIPNAGIMDTDKAKEQLMKFRGWKPYRKWCAMKIDTTSGSLWAFFDSPAKMKRYANKIGLAVFSSISF